MCLDRCYLFFLLFSLNAWTLANEQAYSLRDEKACLVSPSDECVARLKESCRAAKGDWLGHIKGRGRSAGCNLPTKDAGKQCQSKDQCEGACVPNWTANGGSQCVCDSKTKQLKGFVHFCTEKGVVSRLVD
jgi:hypothetical protein